MVKRLRDANAPKKPLSAYFRWMKMNRKRVIRKMPVGYSLKQLTEKMSQIWRALPDEEKASWREKSKEEMKVYTKLVEAYKHTSNYAKFQREKQEYPVTKSDKFRKDPNRPKKSSSGYFLFMADKREETKRKFPKLDHKQVISKLGELWSNLSDEGKQPYLKKADEDKKKWVADINEYEKTDDFKKYMEAKRVFDESRKLSAKGKSGTPKKTNNTKSKILQEALELKNAEKSMARQSKSKEAKKSSSTKARKRSPLVKAVKSTKAKPKNKSVSKVKAHKKKKSAKKSTRTKKKAGSRK